MSWASKTGLLRSTPGGRTANTSVEGLTQPNWLQLVRSGTTFTASYSSNGSTWVTLGSSNLTSFATAALWGLAVTAHTNSLGSVATFDRVALPNASPVLNPITSRTLVAGQMLTVTNTANRSEFTAANSDLQPPDRPPGHDVKSNQRYSRLATNDVPGALHQPGDRAGFR